MQVDCEFRRKKKRSRIVYTDKFTGRYKYSKRNAVRMTVDASAIFRNSGWSLNLYIIPQSSNSNRGQMTSIRHFLFVENSTSWKYQRKKNAIWRWFFMIHCNFYWNRFNYIMKLLLGSVYRFMTCGKSVSNNTSIMRFKKINRHWTMNSLTFTLSF